MFLQLFKNKLFNKMAFLPALIMSAVYHEYVLWAPLRFVMPVLLTQYCTFGGRLVVCILLGLYYNNEYFPLSCVLRYEAITKELCMELPNTHWTTDWDVCNGVLLCDGILRTKDLPQRRECSQYICAEVLRMFPSSLTYIHSLPNNQMYLCMSIDIQLLLYYYVNHRLSMVQCVHVYAYTMSA